MNFKLDDVDVPSALLAPTAVRARLRFVHALPIAREAKHRVRST